MWIILSSAHFGTEKPAIPIAASSSLCCDEFMFRARLWNAWQSFEVCSWLRLSLIGCRDRFHDLAQFSSATTTKFRTTLFYQLMVQTPYSIYQVYLWLDQCFCRQFTNGCWLKECCFSSLNEEYSKYERIIDWCFKPVWMVSLVEKYSQYLWWFMYFLKISSLQAKTCSLCVRVICLLFWYLSDFLIRKMTALETFEHYGVCVSGWIVYCRLPFCLIFNRFKK